jgi:hypothetical protein
MYFSVVCRIKYTAAVLADFCKQDHYHAKAQEIRFTNGEMCGIMGID